MVFLKPAQVLKKCKKEMKSSLEYTFQQRSIRLKVMLLNGPDICSRPFHVLPNQKDIH
jgi:hypothetical protein